MTKLYNGAVYYSGCPLHVRTNITTSITSTSHLWSRPFRQVDRIAWTPLDSACITRPRCIFDEGVTSTALEFTILTRLLHFSPVLASFPSDLVVHVGTVSHLYMAPNSVFLLNSIIFLMSQSMQPSVWSQV